MQDYVILWGKLVFRLKKVLKTQEVESNMHDIN